jgi:hypothetical protein
MAQLGQMFDATQIDPTDNFEPLPAGEYPVVITESEMKPTKNNRGQYLQMTLEVIDGPMKGRKVWDRLNLVNPNNTAVEIAQRQLSSLCHAAGVMNVSDSAQLHNIPVVARVTYKPAEGGYSASNEVKAYKSTGSKPAPQASNQPQHTEQQAPAAAESAPQTAAPAASAPPWARG